MCAFSWVFLLNSDAFCAANLGMPLQEVVMSVPATYNNKQRFAIVEAANNAGLRIQRLINEPTAVALANNAHQAHDSVRRHRRFPR